MDENKQYLANNSAFGIIDALVNYGISPDKTATDNTNRIEILKSDIGSQAAFVFFRPGVYSVLEGTEFPENIKLVGRGASFDGIATSIPDLGTGDGGASIEESTEDPANPAPTTLWVRTDLLPSDAVLLENRLVEIESDIATLEGQVAELEIVLPTVYPIDLIDSQVIPFSSGSFMACIAGAANQLQRLAFKEFSILSNADGDSEYTALRSPAPVAGAYRKEIDFFDMTPNDTNTYKQILFLMDDTREPLITDTSVEVGLTRKLWLYVQRYTSNNTYAVAIYRVNEAGVAQCWREDLQNWEGGLYGTNVTNTDGFKAIIAKDADDNYSVQIKSLDKSTTFMDTGVIPAANLREGESGDYIAIGDISSNNLNNIDFKFKII